MDARLVCPSPHSAEFNPIATGLEAVQSHPREIAAHTQRTQARAIEARHDFDHGGYRGFPS